MCRLVVMRMFWFASSLVLISDAAVAKGSPRGHDALSRDRRAVPCPDLKVDRLFVQSELTELRLSWAKLDDRCRRHTSRIILHWEAEEGKNGTESLESHVEYFVIAGLMPWEEVDIEAYVQYHSAEGEPEGRGPTTRKTTRTLKGKPSAPRRFAAAEVRQSEVTVEWDVPETRNGPIDGYEWNVCDVPSCDEDLSTGCKIAKDVGKVFSKVITGLRPLNSYLFFLYAYNKNDGARRTISDPAKLCVTAPPPPVPPLTGVTAECSSNPNKVSVSWNPAPKQDMYKMYHVSLARKMVDGNDTVEAKNVDQDSVCKDEKCSFTFENLKGDADYRTSVRPYHVSVGPFGEGFLEVSCRVAPSAPPPATKQLVLIEDPTLNDTEKAFGLWKDTFSDDNGPVKHYDVLVADGSATGQCTDPKTWKEAHSKSPILCYVVSPEKWMPFESGQEVDDGMGCVANDTYVHCVLGRSENCEEGRCNGPLKTGLKYAVMVRAHTDGGSMDTEPLYFTAGSKPGSKSGSTGGQGGTRTALNIILTIGLPLLLSMVLIH